MYARIALRRQRESGSGLRAGLALLTAAALTACAPQPEPRTAFDFREDGIAREGVLSRCNQDRDATLADEECANARRAAATIALQAERDRQAGLERESAAQPASFDVFAERGDPLGRRSLEIAAAEPPANDLQIAPELDLADLTILPRPSREDSARR